MNFEESSLKSIPCGLVARIRRSHRRGRGSIPRKGAIVIILFLFKTRHSKWMKQ